MYHNLNKVRKITLTALLVAIIFLLTFTPLGYLVIGPIAATTIQMPVIIGAVLLGPVTGLVLGGHVHTPHGQEDLTDLHQWAWWGWVGGWTR